jgi:hypothetical protein
MEIPSNLKSLYKHWEKHSSFKVPTEIAEISIDNEIFKQMQWFINERMNIWEKKTQNHKLPYTNNKILSTFRFCNIYRELDKQTIYFHVLLNKYRDNLPLWLLNMLFARFVCNPQTIEKVGLLSFDKENNKKVMERLINLPRPKYGNAYIFPISIILKSDFPTREEFFTMYLPEVIKDCAKEIEKFKNVSVIEALNNILPIFKFNFKFHWTEVLIDLAYQYPEKINLYDKFPIGPGSIPTMKLLNSREKPEDVCFSLFKKDLTNIHLLTFNGKTIPLSCENWEGVGCEYRKYTNLKNKKGRRRLFY